MSLDICKFLDLYGNKDGYFVVQFFEGLDPEVKEAFNEIALVHESIGGNIGSFLVGVYMGYAVRLFEERSNMEIKVSNENNE